MIYALIAMLFPPLAFALGSDSYRERELATSLLRATWPYSTPSVLEATKSDNPERRARALVLIREAREREYRAQYLVFDDLPMFVRWLAAVDYRDIRWDIVLYAYTLPKGDLALKILYMPPEKTKLPWLPYWVDVAYGNDLELRRTFCKIANRMKPGTLLDCDPEFKTRVHGENNPKNGLGGVSNLRFWLRGFPDPSWDEKAKQFRGFDEIQEMEAEAKRPRPGIIPYPDLPKP